MKDKSSMQKLLAELRRKKESITDTDRLSRMQKGAYVDAILLAESLLADEKKQIVEAFYNGIACTNSYSNVWELINGGDFRADLKDYYDKFE